MAASIMLRPVQLFQSPCFSSTRCTPSCLPPQASTLRHFSAIRGTLQHIRTQAEPDNKASSSGSTSTTPKEEDRLEELEAQIRGKRTANTPSNFKRTIPIRGVNQPVAKDPESNLAEWKEGELLPAGWEKMSWPQRVNEIYVGKRGVLFWINKSAYASVFIMIGAWFVFRVVGPNLGWWKLAD